MEVRAQYQPVVTEAQTVVIQWYLHVPLSLNLTTDNGNFAALKFNKTGTDNKYRYSQTQPSAAATQPKLL